jgi:hypothetical protein
LWHTQSNLGPITPRKKIVPLSLRVPVVVFVIIVIFVVVFLFVLFLVWFLTKDYIGCYGAISAVSVNVLWIHSVHGANGTPYP